MTSHYPLPHQPSQHGFILSRAIPNLIVSDLLTPAISMIRLFLEEARRVFADLRREVSPMDMTAVTFVALLILMLVFFAWWDETAPTGLTRLRGGLKAADEPPDRREVRAASRELH